MDRKDNPSILAFSTRPSLHQFPFRQKDREHRECVERGRFFVRHPGRYLSFRQRCLTQDMCKGGDHENRSESRKPGANSFSTCYCSIARHPLSRRKASYLIRLQQRLDTIASMRCGSSTIRKRYNPHLSAPALANTGQMSNVRCSWSGTRLTASAPNASSPFSLP